MVFPATPPGRLYGRDVTWQPRMTTPDTPPPRQVPLAGLATFAVVLVGLVTAVVGVFLTWGLGPGLIAVGTALLAVERWPRTGPGDASG